MSTNTTSPSVDTHQVVAAGLASTGAAFVTSRFGVAGTLLGAALTAMIITGGSALLRAYIENAAGRVRSGATRLRERREAAATQAGPTNATPEYGVYTPAGDGPTQRNNPPGRPDLRDNFVGRMRAAVDWFRNLPTPSRRPILIKALVAAALAFAVCMVAVWGVEKIIGNSLSCGLWRSCPYGAAPGIHPIGFGDAGAGSSLTGGGVDLGGGGAIDSIRQGGGLPDGVDIVPGGGDAPSSASPAPGGGDAPSSASPAPGGGEDPASASPAPADDPSSASPAAKEQASPDASASPAP